MRVKVREIVDIDQKDLDKSQLPPLQQLTVALKRYLRDAELFRRQRERAAEKKFKEKMEKEEGLKRALLTYIYRKLVLNGELESRGMRAVKLKLTVHRSLESVLEEIKNHREFVSYELNILPCDPDLLLSYPNIPIILEITERVIGGDGNEEENRSIVGIGDVVTQQ